MRHQDEDAQRPQAAQQQQQLGARVLRHLRSSNDFDRLEIFRATRSTGNSDDIEIRFLLGFYDETNERRWDLFGHPAEHGQSDREGEDVEDAGGVFEERLGREEEAVGEDLERQLEAHEDDEAELGDLDVAVVSDAVARRFEHHRYTRQRRHQDHHPVQVRHQAHQIAVVMCFCWFVCFFCLFSKRKSLTRSCRYLPTQRKTHWSRLYCNLRSLPVMGSLRRGQ